MSDRVIPPPDKFASCPYDGQVLEYFSGTFESVYVLLHPFLRPKNIPVERFCPERWPTKKELIEGTEAVSWAEVIAFTSLSSINEIDIGLRTSIGGLKKELANDDYADELSLLTNRRKIIHPSEGDVSPLIENVLYDCLQQLGHEWLWVGDEFCTERKLWWIEDLKDSDEIPSHGCVFTPDKSILVTTHWDSHFSFLCSSKSIANKILSQNKLEGFYCLPDTEVYWSVAN